MFERKDLPRAGNGSNPILPEPLQDLVLEYFDGDICENKSEPNVYNDRNSCTFFEGGAKEKPYDKLALHVLLGHVARGEQKQAETIIQTNPELLFKLGRARDFPGNTFVNYSPVALARYAYDIDMLEMMDRYIDPVENGREQFIDILKKADAEAKEQKTYDFSPLINAIKSDDAAQIKKAFEEFRKVFEPRIIKNEKHYNITNLINAYQVYKSFPYDQSFDPQAHVFGLQGIGYVQRSLPACYIQAYCSGLCFSKPLERSFNLQPTFPTYWPEGSGKKLYIDSLGEQSYRRLGFNMMIYSNGRLGFDSGDSLVSIGNDPIDLKRYIEKQQQRYRQLLCMTGTERFLLNSTAKSCSILMQRKLVG